MNNIAGRKFLFKKIKYCIQLLCVITNNIKNKKQMLLCSTTNVRIFKNVWMFVCEI